MDYKDKKDRENLYSDAIGKWGRVAQLGMAQEEAMELALAIRKFARQPQNYERINDLIDELADNEIMREQLEFMYPKFKARIKDVKEFKLSRLRNRINNNQFNG